MLPAQSDDLQHRADQLAPLLSLRIFAFGAQALRLS
jgi:hypothetical protein